jgi:hypothetical protein
MEDIIGVHSLAVMIMFQYEFCSVPSYHVVTSQHTLHSQIFFFLHKTGERSLCIPHAYNPAFIGGCVGSKAGQEVVEKRKKYTFGNYQVNTGLLHAFRNCHLK